MKKLISLFVISAFLLTLVPLPTAIAENGNGTVQILYAGQDIEVGTVTVTNDAENLFVEYKITEDDWCITETHVHVVKSSDDFPLNRGGNPQIGHFAYKEKHDPCVTEYEYEIPLSDGLWGAEDELKIAAHAVIEKEECDTTEDTLTPELTWKRSTERTTQGENPVVSFSGYGAQWTLEQAFAIELDDAQVVWDKGAYQLKPDISASKWASWKYAYNWSGPDPNVDSGGYNGYSDLRRFNATFEVPEGYSVISGTISTVDGFDGIPINDNVYIFVNEELLFWGGTRVNQIPCGQFIGMPGVQALRGDTEPKETDRWYIPGTLPSVIEFEVGTNHLDVFTEENERWGGMGALKLTLDVEITTCTIEDQTAWADGTRFTERGNWATYFKYTVQKYEVTLLSVEYVGTCDKFGSHIDDKIIFTFSNDVFHDPDIEVKFETAQRLWEGWGADVWEFNGNTAIVTPNRLYRNPRNMVDDKVMDITGMLDAIYNPVVVPDGGVEIEIYSTYDMIGTWELTSNRLIVIETQTDGSFTGKLTDASLVELGNINGTIDGDSITMDYDRGGYVTDGYYAEFTGIMTSCDSASGTYIHGNDGVPREGEFDWDIIRQ